MNPQLTAGGFLSQKEHAQVLHGKKRYARILLQVEIHCLLGCPERLLKRYRIASVPRATEWWFFL